MQDYKVKRSNHEERLCWNSFFRGILLATWHSLWADIIRVSEQQPSLYAAIAAAKSDDSIILAPGTYLAKDMVHVDKKLTIASEYLHGGDYDMVDQTIIKGAPEAVSQWFNIAKEAEGTRLIGLTFEGNSLHSLALCPAIDYNMFFDNAKDWDEGLPVGKNMFKADLPGCKTMRAQRWAPTARQSMALRPHSRFTMAQTFCCRRNCAPAKLQTWVARPRWGWGRTR